MPVPSPVLSDVRWQPQPAAFAWVKAQLEALCADSPALAALGRSLRERTGTRLLDWLDFLAVAGNPADDLRALGFQPVDLGAGGPSWQHPGAVLPTVRTGGLRGAGIKVESVADFLAARHAFGQGYAPAITGLPGGRLRSARWAHENGVELLAVERRGWNRLDLPPDRADLCLCAARHGEAFRLRRRHFDDEAEGFAHATALAQAAGKDLGRDWTCALFFGAERGYWMARNRTGQAQWLRQQQLGLGWGNHDHHTYRSSRRHFKRLVAFMESLGLHCRERFSPGPGAGWGAQVMEQPVAGITVFADVDVLPTEILGDFAHEPLPELPKLNTVGLWCALHGEAFLQAGMHHLECQFDFDSLRAQLKEERGIGMMPPFSDLPFLRQQFSEGERWPVAGARVDALLQAGLVTPQQADAFKKEGAIGSHLENLERNDGYKGFNQSGIDQIIAGTDPRLLAQGGKPLAGD